jgi:hypothetical protein
LLDDYGLQFDTSRPCETIPGADHVDIEACPLVAADQATQLPAAAARPPLVSIEPDSR